MTPVKYKQSLRDTLNIAPEVVERLFNLFFTSVQSELENLKSAIDTNAMEKIYEVSHKISGSASNLRLEKIMDLARKIEINAKQNNQENFSIIYQELCDAFHETKSEVEQEASIT